MPSGEPSIAAAARTAGSKPSRVTLSVRVDPAVRDALERAAHADDRSVTGYVSLILTRHLKAEGYLKEEDPLRP